MALVTSWRPWPASWVRKPVLCVLESASECAAGNSGASSCQWVTEGRPWPKSQLLILQKHLLPTQQWECCWHHKWHSSGEGGCPPPGLCIETPWPVDALLYWSALRHPSTTGQCNCADPAEQGVVRDTEVEEGIQLSLPDVWGLAWKNEVSQGNAKNG